MTKKHAIIIVSLSLLSLSLLIFLLSTQTVYPQQPEPQITIKSLINVSFFPSFWLTLIFCDPIQEPVFSLQLGRRGEKAKRARARAREREREREREKREREGKARERERERGRKREREGESERERERRELERERERYFSLSRWAASAQSDPFPPVGAWLSSGLRMTLKEAELQPVAWHTPAANTLWHSVLSGRADTKSTLLHL